MRCHGPRIPLETNVSTDEWLLITDIVTSPKHYYIFAYIFSRDSIQWTKVSNGCKRRVGFFPVEWKEKYPHLCVLPGYKEMCVWHPLSVYNTMSAYERRDHQSFVRAQENKIPTNPTSQ